MPRFHAPTDVSAGPPPEVLAQIDAAWERAQELFHDEAWDGLNLTMEHARELLDEVAATVTQAELLLGTGAG